MPDTGTKKKLTKVSGGDSPSAGVRETKPFVATDESKKKAAGFRAIAIIAWVLAIGFEVVAILFLKRQPISMLWLIVFIAADMVMAIIGSLLWKKANRFDPASEKDKVRFAVQNQLGVIIAVIAFLPLVVLIFANKDMNGKQKGILGALAVAALVIAGIVGVDFNPPSVEEYAEQTQRVEDLTGGNLVYWTEHGTKYHVYSDCYRINTSRTDEIFEGSVAKARELKNINELCSTCEDRAEKENAAAEPAAASR